MDLSAYADDWTLHATGDTRQEERSFLFDYYLTDPSGNYLTDPSGNRLVGRLLETLYPIALHAQADDWNLRA